MGIFYYVLTMCSTKLRGKIEIFELHHGVISKKQGSGFNILLNTIEYGANTWVMSH